MPRQNQFRHQTYVPWNAPPIPTTVAAACSDDVADIDVGQTLQRLRVKHWFLVHGTFVGSDPFGIAQQLDDLTESVPPMWRPALKALAMESWGRVVRSISQKFGDRVLGETGSFRDDYLDDLRLLLGNDETQIARFDWSSGNDHVARTEAAIALFLKLTDLPLDPTRDRVLLWGHSHAGNVFALLTNLLANDRDSVAAFFEAAGTLGENRISWAQARERLLAAPSPHPLAKALCVVTFGSPLRYGWDTDGYSKLLHIVHHRPEANLPTFQAKPALPQTVDEIVGAKYGDWIQSFGLAGTDLIPLDRERREVHRSLKVLLETGLNQPDHNDQKTVLDHLPDSVQQRVRGRLSDLLVLLQRWRCGPRVAADGDAAWLFDYGEEETAKFGHGVYTKRTWLPFHASRIAAWLRSALES